MRQGKLSLADYVIAGLFGATVMVVGSQVVFRYAFNSSLTWTEELSRYLFSWIIFLGAAIAVKDGAHIGVDFLIVKLPAKVAGVLRLLNYSLMLAFLVLIVMLGFMLVYRTAGTVSPALSLPINYVYYAALPVTFLLGIYYTVKKIVSMVHAEGDKNKKEAK